MSHEGQSPPEQTVLDSTEILAVINADPRLTRTQVLERKINRGFIRSKKHEEMECFVYHILAQDMRLCNPFPAPIFEAPKTFCMENMPSVTATPRYPLLRIGNSLHFIYVAIDEAFCSTVSNTHILRAKLQHLIVSKSLQEDVYTHLCVFNPITNTKAVVDIHDLDDDDEADLLSKIHQADRIFSTVLLPIIQEMKGSSPQVTSKDVGEFFYERDQPDSIKVGSKVFHSKQEKFGIVKKQLSPEKVLVHWEGDAAKVGDKNVDIKYVYPVPILSPRQPVQAGQRVVIIAGKRVDLVGRTGKLVQLNTMKGKVRLADGEEVQMRLCYLHAMDELVCLTEAQRSWHVSDAEAERFEMELELDLIQQENIELCVG